MEWDFQGKAVKDTAFSLALSDHFLRETTMSQRHSSSPMVRPMWQGPEVHTGLGLIFPDKGSSLVRAAPGIREEGAVQA